MASVARSPVVAAVSNAGDVLKNANPFAVIRECVEYLKCHEEEQTKRAHIIAQRDVLVHAINTEKELLLTYFEQRFAERRASLEQLFTLLRQGVDSGDSHSVDAALMGILGILQANPLADLGEFRRAWSNPHFMIEL